MFFPRLSNLGKALSRSGGVVDGAGNAVIPWAVWPRVSRITPGNTNRTAGDDNNKDKLIGAHRGTGPLKAA